MSLKTAAAIWSLACTLACAPNIVHAQDKRVFAPGSTVPLTGMAYGGIGESATPVTPASPFPVTCISGCSGGGGGSGGPTSIADGADQALGAKADAAWSGSGGGSSIAILKAIRNLLASPLAVTGTFWQATQPVSAVSLPLPAGAATAPNQATANASLASIDTRMADGQMTAGSVKAGRAVIVDAAGAPLNWTDPVPVTQSAGPWTTRPTATSSGGCTPYGYQSAASVNATLVATGARTLCSLSVINTTASLYYLRIYDLAAAPTCSSATGFIRTVPIPAGTSGAGVALPIGAFGEAYAAGLGFCITGGPSSSDNTNAAVGVFVVGSYK